MAPTPAKIPLK